MELIAVAAVSENGIIGRGGELPWPSIPEDKHQYRNRVAGDPVILGRRTYESMREELPGVQQIVLSRDPAQIDLAPTATGVRSVKEATAAAGNVEKAYVLGGGGAYELFFPVLDRLIISRIPGRYCGSVTFPAIDPNRWACIAKESFHEFTLETWELRE